MTAAQREARSERKRLDAEDRGEPIRDDADRRQIGRILIDCGSTHIDWTLRPDRRDVRRWYAVDPAGNVVAHAACASILRMIAASMPRALGRRQW